MSPSLGPKRGPRISLWSSRKCGPQLGSGPMLGTTARDTTCKITSGPMLGTTAHVTTCKIRKVTTWKIRKHAQTLKHKSRHNPKSRHATTSPDSPSPGTLNLRSTQASGDTQASKSRQYKSGPGHPVGGRSARRELCSTGAIKPWADCCGKVLKSAHKQGQGRGCKPKCR